ncbi:serine/threonine-protein kinase [Aeromicrobium panaciterrae]|uniref:non-specific serine/threonine protein kinase n=1 Tax=Aeromicrobium panaciterrae TaxID=363861 RepID=A0ABU1UN92_9ACTN|nr:protein kinase [Aeromicrobium panaciterrae]MDR7086635.1 serine/threonine-protein kinase [Aeromicrobium panaciterrae]
MPKILGDRYRLDAVIGNGGMGEVWRAHDQLLNREVAVKVIREHLADDESIRERLRTEAHLAGSLHHQNIVDVYDYGEHPDEHGRTTPYLVMPLVDGVSLSAMLKSRVALPVGETMSIISEMASALAAAHEAGIVHRDLKPGNVLLSASGRVMILDFGIARSTGGESLTKTGALIGTADYLSPEQASGRQATYASDLYALGIVAYTCLTGAPPFHRETDVATALAHIQAPIPELPDEILASGIGPLIESMLAKEPGQRPSASEVAAIAGELATTVPTEVERATDPDATQPGVTTPTVGVAAPTGVLPAVSDEATAEVVTEDRQRPRRTVLISSAVLALAAIIFALLYINQPTQVEVPDVRKMSSVKAAATLASKGFKVETHDVDAAGYKPGVVVTQSPEAGSDADKGSSVDLGVATGFVAIPKNIVGKSYEDAAKIVDKLGLVPQRNDQPSGETAGTVTTVDPSKRAEPGSVVVLTVSTGSGGNDSKDEKKKGKNKKKTTVEPTATATTEPPATDADADAGDPPAAP